MFRSIKAHAKKNDKGKEGPMKRKLYGEAVEPACEYCAHGRPSKDGKSILCERHGVLPPDYRCRRFRYDPLKRKPRPAPELPRFSPEDFSLD